MPNSGVSESKFLPSWSLYPRKYLERVLPEESSGSEKREKQVNQKLKPGAEVEAMGVQNI